MKLWNNLLITVLAGLLIVGCSSPVYVQKDDSVNLNNYHTYMWVDTRANENDQSTRATAYVDMNVKNANYHLWWVNTGAAVYDSISGGGVAFCSPDAPLLSIGEPGEYKFDSTFSGRKPYFYLNLYNNQWRTNFPAWIGHGQRMNASLRLWSFDQFNAESALFTPAMETRVPLVAAASKLQKGKLPQNKTGISLSRKGIAVTAFGNNPDGDGTVLRLWEQAGVSGKLAIQLPEEAPFTAAQPVNLRGEKKGEKIAVNHGKFSVDVAAYAPVSLVLN